MNTHKIFSSLKIIVLALIIAVGVQYVRAWTAAPGTPPTCTTGYPGCDAPVNVSSSALTKLGPLTVNGSTTAQAAVGLYAWGQAVFNTGGVGASALQIIDGSQGVGKVLTSDASGTATWQSPGASSTVYATAADESIATGFNTLSWITVNLGTSGGGLGLVPTGATAVILRGTAYAYNSGSTDDVSLLVRPTGSNSTGKNVAEASGEVGSGGSGYQPNHISTDSGSTIVPLGTNQSIDYQLTETAASSYHGSLYVTGYVGGGTIAPPSPTLTCSLLTDGDSTGLTNTNSNNTPVNIRGTMTGGSEAYTYAFNLGLGGGYGSYSSPSSDSYKYSIPGGYNQADIYGVGVEAKGATTGTVYTALCPQLTITYPQLNVSNLTCTTGSVASSGGSGSGEIDKVTYTSKNTPTGGQSPYTYAFMSSGDGDSPDTYTQSSSPAGITSSPGSMTAYSSTRPITVTYGDASGGSVNTNPSDLYVLVKSGDDQIATTSVPICQAPSPLGK